MPSTTSIRVFGFRIPLPFLELDLKECNLTSAVLSILTAVLVFLAFGANEWITTNPVIHNGTLGHNETDSLMLLDPSNPFELELLMEMGIQKVLPCDYVGSAHFVRPARFSSITSNGKRHMFYIENHSCLINCINPMMANYFYVVIAICAVTAFTSMLCAALHYGSPQFGFIIWLKANSVLEICNLVMFIMALTLIVLSERELQAMRPELYVGMGVGGLMLQLATLLTILSGYKGHTKNVELRKHRRVHNQRLMCIRTLRSWRDVSQRSEDRRPIIDFERYLLEPGLRPEQGQTESEQVQT